MSYLCQGHVPKFDARCQDKQQPIWLLVSRVPYLIRIDRTMRGWESSTLDVSRREILLADSLPRERRLERVRLEYRRAWRMCYPQSNDTAADEALEAQIDVTRLLLLEPTR